MRPRLFHFLILLHFSVIRLGAAADQSPVLTPPVSLQVLPRDPKLWGAETSQHFIVLAKFADGLERDVTFQTHFEFSEKEKGEIDRSGKFRSLGSGNVVLTAQ